MGIGTFLSIVPSVSVETFCPMYLILTGIPWALPPYLILQILQLREVKKPFHGGQQANGRVGTETRLAGFKGHGWQNAVLIMPIVGSYSGGKLSLGHIFCAS